MLPHEANPRRGKRKVEPALHQDAARRQQEKMESNRVMKREEEILEDDYFSAAVEPRPPADS